MMLVFLIGFMACGKSTIGGKLKKIRKDAVLIDTDNVIEQRAGMSVGEIFDQFGEEYFRKLESDLLGELIEQGRDRDYIVSTGGGLPMWGDNMERMNGAGATIYISRTAENIASRLSMQGRQKRPKLRGLNDSELIEYMAHNINLRDEVYRKSQLIIDAVPLSDSDILSVITNFIDHR